MIIYIVHITLFYIQNIFNINLTLYKMYLKLLYYMIIINIVYDIPFSYSIVQLHSEICYLYCLYP